MNHLRRAAPTLALALGLVLPLGACSKTPDPTSTSSDAGTAGAVDGTGTGAGTGGSTADGSGDPTTGVVPTSTGPVVVDQKTPEAAMTSWLNAMVAGEGDTVCRLMATGGRTIASIPGATKACGARITPLLEELKQLGGAFAGLTITGATVTGDRASFTSVTTEPPMAAQVVSPFKAVRIKDKWYVTQD